MKEIKKRVKRALCLLQNPRGSSIRSIFKLVNEDEPALALKTVVHQVHDEVNKGHLIARNGRFKLFQQEEDAYEDYDFDDVEEDEEDDDDEEDEGDEMEDYMKVEMDGPDHSKGDKENDKDKDDKTKSLEPPKTENENDNTVAQPYEAKCYPCTKKRKRSACPKKKRSACPKKKRSACPKKKRSACPKKKRSACPKKKRSACPKKKRSCPMKKKRSGCPKKRPSCPKKKPSCPSKRKPKKCNIDEEEDDREVKATSPVASFNSFDLGRKSSLRNRMERIDLKKQIRGPRCTSMKKEIRMPSRVQLPLVNPMAVPQKTYDELARRSPEPVSGPLFDENKEMIVDSERPSFSFPQI